MRQSAAKTNKTDGGDESGDADDEEVSRDNLKVTPERDDAVFFTTLCVSDRCNSSQALEY